MFRNRVVFFMIYYFKAIKSLVDTNAKNSLTQPISEATAPRPRAALPQRDSRRHSDFVDRGCGRK